VTAHTDAAFEGLRTQEREDERATERHRNAPSPHPIHPGSHLDRPSNELRMALIAGLSDVCRYDAAMDEGARFSVTLGIASDWSDEELSTAKDSLRERAEIRVDDIGRSGYDVHVHGSIEASDLMAAAVSFKDAVETIAMAILREAEYRVVEIRVAEERA
jgi:hypothetical protein